MGRRKEITWRLKIRSVTLARSFGDCRRGRHCLMRLGYHVLAQFFMRTWGNHGWVPQLSDSPPNSSLEIFIPACVSERSPCLTTTTWLKGNCNENAKKKKKNYAGLWTGKFHPEAENPVPIWNKTKRITRICSARGHCENAHMCTHGWCTSSLALPPVSRSRQDRCSEGERELGQGERTLRGSDVRVFLCRGQVADCWSWEMKAWEDHWSIVQYTLLWEMAGSPLFHVLRFSPPCPWAGDASGSGVCAWVLGGSERPAPTHQGWDASWGQRRIWKKTEGVMTKDLKKKRESERRAWCAGMQYSSNTQDMMMSDSQQPKPLAFPT